MNTHWCVNHSWKIEYKIIVYFSVFLSLSFFLSEARWKPHDININFFLIYWMVSSKYTQLFKSVFQQKICFLHNLFDEDEEKNFMPQSLSNLNDWMRQKNWLGQMAVHVQVVKLERWFQSIHFATLFCSVVCGRFCSVSFIDCSY